MSRILRGLFLAISVTLAVGCGGSAPANSATPANVDNRRAGNGEIKLDPANMPPGLSGSPVPMTGDIPGISANGATLPKPTAPIPGIPSESDLKKRKKPGTTPTPGIPDEETLRKAMGYPPRNAKVIPRNSPQRH